MREPSHCVLAKEELSETVPHSWSDGVTQTSGSTTLSPDALGHLPFRLKPILL